MSAKIFYYVADIRVIHIPYLSNNVPIRTNRIAFKATAKLKHRFNLASTTGQSSKAEVLKFCVRFSVHNCLNNPSSLYTNDRLGHPKCNTPKRSDSINPIHREALIFNGLLPLLPIVSFLL